MNNKDIKKIDRTINILHVVKLFLEGNYYIKDISNITGYSTSCIQRYLNDPIIKEILGSTIEEEIQNKLSKNLVNGKKKDAENYVLNNEAMKLENGKFCGSFPRVSM